MVSHRAAAKDTQSAQQDFFMEVFTHLTEG